MKTEGINITGNRCHCPACEKEGQKLAYCCPWISPVGKLVCFYAVCGKCGEKTEKMPPLLQSAVMDKVERNLLEWYPELRENLPPGYEAYPVQNQTFN